LKDIQSNIGAPYLKIQVDRKIGAIIPMNDIQEVLLVPVKRITPIPNMASCVMGLLHQRGRVLWTLDLAQMLEMNMLDTNLQQYHILILKIDNTCLGLVVYEIKGIIRLTEDLIKSPLNDTIASVSPYVQGSFLQKQEILLILNPSSFVNSSLLQQDRALF
jgi:twitching motility protein PilI